MLKCNPVVASHTTFHFLIVKALFWPTKFSTSVCITYRPVDIKLLERTAATSLFVHVLFAQEAWRPPNLSLRAFWRSLTNEIVGVFSTPRVNRSVTIFVERCTWNVLRLRPFLRLHPRYKVADLKKRDDNRKFGGLLSLAWVMYLHASPSQFCAARH